MPNPDSPARPDAADPSSAQDAIETQRVVGLLRLVIALTSALILLLVLGALMGSNVPHRSTAVAALWLPVLGLCWLGLQHGRVRLVALVLPTAFFVLLTVGNASLGTIRTPTAGVYVFWVILMGMLFKRTGIVVATTLSSATILALILAENAGLLPAPNYSVGVTQWINYTGLFVLSATLVYFGNRTTELALIKAREEIDKRTQVEQALRQREAVLEKIGRMAHIGAWHVDLASGQPTWSPETCRIHDLPEGHQPTLAEALAYYAPESRPVIEALVERGTREGQPWDVELRMFTATGRPIWVRALGEAEFHNGQPVALVGAVQDITAQREAVESLARYEQVIETASDCFYMVDLDDGIRMVHVNEAARRHFGAPRELICQWRLPDWDPDFPPEQVPALVANILAARSLSLETRHRLYDGRVVPVEVTVNLYVDDRGRHLCFGWFRDISQRHETQRLQAEARARAESASQAKSDFLATMSHEIRTPMNAVLGMLQLLDKTELQPQQRDYVKKTEGAARSLLGIINDVLDFSKIEAGKLTLDPQPASINQLLHDLSVIYSASVGKQPIEVLFDIDPALPGRWLVDAMRLQQILINLGSNAIKFTERGEVVVSVQVLGAGPRDDQRWVRFAVRDTGIGIAAEHQARIFEGFTQAESSTTRRFGGTGLGLVISRRLVELMGGQLALESVPGQGSRFWFDLPLTLLGEAGAARTPAPLPGLSVLIVDDHPKARELLAGMAASFGWAVSAVDSGPAALALIESRRQRREPPFGVYLLDWQMPDMDGWQTAAHIRALYRRDSGPASDHPLLVMMMTLQARESLLRQSAQVLDLIDGYLVKPVTASMVHDLVQTLLHREQHPSAAPAAGTPMRPLAGLRLLVVEDNAVNQQVAEELLGGQGARVDIADQGLAGVEAVRAAHRAGQPYDVVLMDMQMPVMDGLSATRLLRTEFPASALPIIAMTANAMADDRQACLAAGMNDHVGKPFDLRRLVATLIMWTRRPALAPADPVEASPVTPPVTSPVSPPTPTPGHQAPPPTQPGAPDPDPQDALVDRDGAQARLGGDVHLLNRLSAQFLQQLPELLLGCDAAVVPATRDQGLRALHSLKGVAATIGAAALSRAARAGEAACRAGETPDLDALHRVARDTEQSLRALGVRDTSAPAPTPQVPAADGEGPDTPLPPAQQARLARLMALLEGSDMGAFDALDELMAADPPALAARWAGLHESVQAMDFAAALQQARRIGHNGG